MPIKKVPIINIDINNVKRNIEQNKANTPVCPYCKRDILRDPGYILCENKYEVTEMLEYYGRDNYSFRYMDDEPPAHPSYKYYCPLCNAKLTKAQAEKLLEGRYKCP